MNDWENCRIGSCQRHQACMYGPCRSTASGLKPPVETGTGSMRSTKAAVPKRQAPTPTPTLVNQGEAEILREALQEVVKRIGAAKSVGGLNSLALDAVEGIAAKALSTSIRVASAAE